MDLPHANIYVRLPATQEITEQNVLDLFSQFGDIDNIRVYRPAPGTGVPHALIRYVAPASAAAAIVGMNGSMMEGQPILVKLADADVVPRVHSGQIPSEWVYCRGLPSHYSREDVILLFAPFIPILEIKIFPSTEAYKGTGALVQLESVNKAALAIGTLNNCLPPSSSQPMLARFADSPSEKAAKAARKERMMTRTGSAPLAALMSALPHSGGSAASSGGQSFHLHHQHQHNYLPDPGSYNHSAALADQLQRQLLELSLVAAAQQQGAMGLNGSGNNNGSNGSHTSAFSNSSPVGTPNLSASLYGKSFTDMRLSSNSDGGATESAINQMLQNNHHWQQQLQQQQQGASLHHMAGLPAPMLAAAAMAAANYNTQGKGLMSTAAAGNNNISLMDVNTTTTTNNSNTSNNNSNANTDGSSSIYITGLPDTTDRLWLFEKFCRYGGILSLRVSMDEGTGKCSGVAFIKYTSAEAALAAQLSLNGLVIGDRMIQVIVQNIAVANNTAGNTGGHNSISGGHVLSPGRQSGLPLSSNGDGKSEGGDAGSFSPLTQAASLDSSGRGLSGAGVFPEGLLDPMSGSRSNIDAGGGEGGGMGGGGADQQLMSAMWTI
jgi:hypothetical protein